LAVLDGAGFGEFSPLLTVKMSMLNTEYTPTAVVDDTEWVAEPAAGQALEPAEAVETGLDAESLFAADLSATTVLTPSEEEAITRRIVRTRHRVRRVLRKAKPLTRAALQDRGRGVVLPDADFREREAVEVLRFAQSLLRSRRMPRAIGMTRQKVRAFESELSAALAEYRALRDQMIRANVRLVNVLARRYRHPTLSFLDLFQEGAMGLFRAVEKYDPGRNIKFSTYATWWIWQQLGRAGDIQGSLIRTPVHWNQLRRRLSRGVHAAASERQPSREAVAEMEGLDPEQLDRMGQTFHFVSVDVPMGDEDERTLEALLPAGDAEPEEQLVQAALRRHLERALDQLPRREQLILRHRFGLEHDDAQTLDQIGTSLGVSRERVRQLESRALRHLRDVCAASGLRDYLH
jgi:RNA polymerase sigma factor (sigma-70 family)